MALTDQIMLAQAEDRAGAYSPINPAASVSSGLQGGNQLANQFRDNNEEAAAQQFQAVLNQGFKAMQQTYAQLPPESQMAVGDPTFYQKDEDHMASWWGLVAKQQEKVKKQEAITKAAGQVTAGDDAGAYSTMLGADAIDAGTGLSGMAKARDAQTQKDRRAKIPGLMDKFTPKESTQTVDGAIDLDSQFGRQFKISSKRMDAISEHIESASSEHGVPANLIKAIISQESAGKNGLTSSAGAHGYMQLIPSTAKAMGVKDSADAAQNIKGGTKYIKQQLDKYGDVEKALAAYNAGPATVDRLTKKYGDKWKEYLPDETKDYLEKVPNYLKAYGGATFSSKSGGNQDPKLYDLYKEAVATDPNLVEDPVFKAGLDALDKDADNRRQTRADVASERLVASKQAQLEKRVQLLDKKIEPKMNISRVVRDLDELLPGGVNGTESIPGIGLGDGSLRKWLIGVSKDSKVGKIRAKLAELTNTIIKDRSGLAVTKQEADRIMSELALTPTSTESDFRYALQTKLRNIEQDYLEDLAADPEARDLMLERIPDRVNPFKMKARESGNARTTKSGKKFTVKKTIIADN